MDRRRRNDLHKLDVYRCALQLYRIVGRIVAGFPRGEADLRDQMKRASRSVPFNIGEGVGKRGKARAASYQVALGEDKELIVALDCVETNLHLWSKSSRHNNSLIASQLCSPS